MELIKSENNQWLKKIKALHKKKYRDEYQQFVIEGIRFCEEAILHNASIEALLISEDVVDNENVKVLSSKYDNNFLVIKNNLLEKCLSTVNPQGIAAIINKPQWDINKVLSGNLIVIIDGVQDPGNLGTILRTALAAEVDGIFCLKGTVDLYNDKTLRSTMGAIFNLPVFFMNNKDELINLLQNNFTLVLADVDGEQYHYEYIYPQKVAVVLGSEANGPLQIKKGDAAIKIPLSSKAESLNVAVAGGIILFEIDRQRRLNL